jgi:uncharacterized repeat protein (TIGR01451 family)
VSNLSGAADSVTIQSAPVAGEYQVEVYGYETSEYQLIITAGSAGSLTKPDVGMGGIDPQKEIFDSPAIPLNSRPPTHLEGGAAALSISKNGPAAAEPGNPFTYTLTLTNNGTLPATNLVITDVIPLNATYVSGGILDGNAVTWELLYLEPDKSAQVSFSVKAYTTITNDTFGVSADIGVSALGENSITTLINAGNGNKLFLPFLKR